MLALGANLLFEKSEKVKSPCLAAQKYQKKHIKTKKTNFLKFFVIFSKIGVKMEV